MIGGLRIRGLAKAEDSVEFDISAGPGFRRMGFATEAPPAIFGLIFGPLDRRCVRVSVDPRNTASIALRRSPSMRQETHHRESLRLYGEWVDDVGFALLARERLFFSGPTDPRSSSSR